MTGRPHAGPRPRRWLRSIAALGVAALIGWGCFVGTSELLDSLRTGVLDNRKGPDVVALDRPVLYWALIGFYTAAMLTAVGLALLLSAIALRDLRSVSGADR